MYKNYKYRNQLVRDVIKKDNNLLYSVLYHYTNAIEGYFKLCFLKTFHLHEYKYQNVLHSLSNHHHFLILKIKYLGFEIVKVVQ